MSFEVLNPDALGEPRGWNNGLLAPEGGRLLFVAGQTARRADGTVATDDFAEQFAAALENVLAVVGEAGGGPPDIGRLTIFVTDLRAYRESLERLGRAWRRLMGRHYPAIALVEVTGLVDEGARVEIEATAVIGARPASGAASDDGPAGRAPAD